VSGRLALLGGVVTALAVLGAGPAAADPAGPTHYEARVTDPVPGIAADVLGGDAFLVVRVDRGVEVEVPGYEGEPYVRIGPDGTVEVNQRAPTRWVNDDRYETDPDAAGAPPDVAVDAPPRWEVVGTDGEYAWHDHRIHWMSPSLPRQVDPTAGTPQPVFDWEVPVVVDGEPAAIGGELTWLPGPGPLVPGVVAFLGLAIGAVAGGWARGRRVAVVVLAGAVVAGVVGATKALGLPVGADGEPFLLVLPGLAAVAAGAGLVLGARHRSTWRGALVAGAGGLPLLVWVGVQAGALVRPIVPGPLPVAAVRVVLTVVAAAGVAGLVAAGRAALAATSLDGDQHRPAADAAPTTS
jgi:hypothetical protein